MIWHYGYLMIVILLIKNVEMLLINSVKVVTTKHKCVRLSLYLHMVFVFTESAMCAARNQYYGAESYTLVFGRNSFYWAVQW